MTKQDLTIIVPVYNEAESIPYFIEALTNQPLSLAPRVLFVDDGSTDETVAMIKSMINVSQIPIGYLAFSRNFGKEAAMYAGLQHADSDYVAFMDVDLQDPVSLLPEMIAGVVSGEYDVVAAKRTDRENENIIRSKLSDMFYWVMNKIAGVNLEKGERDFRVMNRQVVDALLSLGESKRFSKGMFHWVGFDTTYISYANQTRLTGTTSWSTLQLVSYAVDGIISFSMRPLLLVSLMGFGLFLLSMVGLLFVVIRAIVHPDSAIFGWASLVSIVMTLSGVQLMAIGVIGRYVADVFIETKNRPQYILKSK